MASPSRSDRFEMDMCTGPLLPKLVSFSLPLILSSVLQLMFNAVDVIVVGKFTGSQALAAVGSTTYLINLIITLMTGISLGANVLFGRFFALKEEKEMGELAHTSIALALWGGLALAVFSLLLSGPALRAMGTPEGVYELALLYLRVYFLGMPFFMLYTYGAAILRAVGDTKRPLAYLIIAGVLNAGLNCFLVIVFDMGVLGVAIATVFSQFVSCVLVLRCLVKTRSAYRIYFKKLKIHKKYLPQLFRIGLPAGLQSFVITFSNVLLQSSVNSLGDIAMAGYAAAHSIHGFMLVIADSFSQTCMSFTSQNYGVRNRKRMNTVLWECALLSMGTLFVVGSLVYLNGDSVVRIFNDEPEVIACGTQVFLYTTTTYFLCGLMHLLPGAMRGMGFSLVPMILSVIGTVGTRVFWIYRVFPAHPSLDVLFISYPFSWVVTLALEISYLIIVKKRVAVSFLAENEP